MFDQLTLFDADSPYPAGLRYAEEFISREVELQLIAHVAALPLQPFQFGAFEGKRRVASFGFRYDFGLRRLQNSEPVPSWLGDVIERVDAFGGEERASRRYFARNMRPAWESAGIATGHISAMCSGCRWLRPAISASGGRSGINGSASRSKRNPARST